MINPLFYYYSLYKLILHRPSFVVSSNGQGSPGVPPESYDLDRDAVGARPPTSPFERQAKHRHRHIEKPIVSSYLESNPRKGPVHYAMSPTTHDGLPNLDTYPRHTLINDDLSLSFSLPLPPCFSLEPFYMPFVSVDGLTYM